MEHPDDGMIRAYLDGEVTRGAGGIRSHLARCSECREKMETQHRSQALVSGALPFLDLDPPMEGARARILQMESRRRNPMRIFQRNLPRAASLVILLTAGAAAAMPGSPVRRWVDQGWEALTERGQGPAGVLSTEPPEGEGLEAPGGVELVGATVPTGQGGVELHIQELPEGSAVTVALVEEEEAGIFAGQGTGFRSEPGRLLAMAPPGDVRVEIPAGASPVQLFVNGGLYLRKTGDGLELTGPVQSRSSTEIRFGPS